MTSYLRLGTGVLLLVPCSTELPVPYYMDRHEVSGATPEDVAKAHALDVEIQDRFGVRFLSYWFDYERQTTFCLVDAPTEDSVRAVHAASHGMLPNQVIPVDAAAVGMFLGRIADPSATGVATSAFRIIMFTDMEGSTALTQRLGDEAAMAVLRSHDAIVREALRVHHGTEVKHTGDGIMASFVLVTEALTGAIAIQRAVATHNASAVEIERQFLVRIGVAAGEPVTERGDLFGAAVQLAARLCGAARGGEICVAEAVSELAIGKRFQFAEAAALDLKGFIRPVRAVRLEWDDSEAAS